MAMARRTAMVVMDCDRERGNAYAAPHSKFAQAITGIMMRGG
jgi:hypothetical protein